MPQLDLNTYISQLFWLIVTLPLLYLFIAKIFLPTVSEVVKKRVSKVEKDLAEAEKLIAKHKALKADIEKILSDARTKALSLKTDIANEAKQVNDKEMKEFEADLAKKTAKELKKLEAMELQLQSELPAIVKNLSKEIFKTVLNLTQTRSEKVN